MTKFERDKNRNVPMNPCCFGSTIHPACQMLTNPWMMTSISKRTGNDASCHLSSRLSSIIFLFQTSGFSDEVAHPDLNGGDDMDKNEWVYFLVVVLVMMLGMVVFHHISPEDKFGNNLMFTRMPASQIVNDLDSEPQYASETNLVAGICGLLLVGYLFWTIYRKSKKDSQAELIARENSLYKISLATGRTEYNLFRKSAEDWAVSGDRIDKDFRRYMAHQILPYYAKDFVRRNQAHIDESLVNKEEVKPTSWSDWVKALLVFPGSLLFLFSISFF